MEKPCTVIPRTSRLLLPGRVTLIFEKSTRCLDANHEASTFSFGRRWVFTIYMMVWDGCSGVARGGARGRRSRAAL